MGSLGVDLGEGHQEMLAEIEQVLDEFKKDFEKPMGLPPQRDRDDAVTLQPGTTPYQCMALLLPHVQKNEIEKLGSRGFGS